VQWICEESGAIFSADLYEPMNKPRYCLGCGKFHVLKPGELEPKDKEILRRIKRGIGGIRIDDDIIDLY
jgi:hypothetical protein